ncbi:MAG: hypothetical protein U9Q03_01140 [Patescibacteria group bacterium]|nr:hypothetical protein [Patescibacteria group bacterium]
MEVITITTGSWFPRTKLHLKEYYSFLKDGRVHIDLDVEKLKELRKQMQPRNVQYVGGRFDRVSAEFDNITTLFHEDGLLTLTVESDDFQEDLKKIREFFEKLLTPSLSILYGLGAPVISYKVPDLMSRPVIILAKGVEDVAARKMCVELDDEVHYIARHPDRTVYFADKHIIVGDESGGAGATKYIIDELILSREYEHRLKQYLELHRQLWGRIADIQQRSSIPSYELPVIRDRLLNYKRDMAIIRARINQMMAYLSERRNEIDDLGLTEDLRAVEAYRFDKLTSSTFYITRLWDMLEEYLDSTVQITGFFYQENLQREINIQQFIFLVGSVAAVMGLGTLAGAGFVVLSADGHATYHGLISSFDPAVLVQFGSIALLASMVFFFGIRPAIRFFRRIRPSALVGRVKKDEDREGPGDPGEGA